MENKFNLKKILYISIKNKKLKLLVGGFLLIYTIFFSINISIIHFRIDTETSILEDKLEKENQIIIPKTINKAEYNNRMFLLANNTQLATSTLSSSTINLWPVSGLPYPNFGALLPFNRIIAFYGNFYSKKMGILGQYDPDIVLQKLMKNVKDFEIVDPITPVIPAIHYIVTTAQGRADANGKYILRMPDSQIQKAIDLAKKVNGIVFLDIQTGNSTVQNEIPLLEKYLKLPQVHLGIDPEFSVKNGQKPGTIIGTLDATDINWTAEYLAKIVHDTKIPPKILIIHRFTEKAVTNYSKIKPLSEVQIVMNMDGWGSPERKIATYRSVIYYEPVQFTGFKVFYNNDLISPSKHLMTPAEILKLRPIPIYIQYQ